MSIEAGTWFVIFIFLMPLAGYVLGRAVLSRMAPYPITFWSVWGSVFTTIFVWLTIRNFYTYYAHPFAFNFTNSATSYGQLTLYAFGIAFGFTAACSRCDTVIHSGLVINPDNGGLQLIDPKIEKVPKGRPKC